MTDEARDIRDRRDLEALVHLIEMRQASVIARLDRAERDYGEAQREYRDLRAHIDACTGRVEEKIEALRRDADRRFNWHGRAAVGILVALIMNLVAVLIGIVPRFLSRPQVPP